MQNTAANIKFSAGLIIFALSHSLAFASSGGSASLSKLTDVGHTMIVMPNNPLPTSNTEQQLQLLQREMSLEQQLASVKQQLLQLQEQALVQTAHHTAANAFSWVNAANGSVPKDAIAMNAIGEKPIYICHVAYGNGVHPGQVAGNGCLITYSGRAITETHYQVLTGKNKVEWRAANTLYRYAYQSFNPISFAANNLNFDGAVTLFPITGGYESAADGERQLYICRAMYNDGIHIGKVVTTVCNIGWQGTEVSVPTYEVLFG